MNVNIRSCKISRCFVKCDFFNHGVCEERRNTKLLRPLQYMVPFEIAEEKTNIDIATDNEIWPTPIAAANKDLKRRLTTDIV